MYISYVAKARLSTAVFSQLSIFTADYLWHLIQMGGGGGGGWCRNHMGVAHSYKLLVIVIPNSKQNESVCLVLGAHNFTGIGKIR